MCELKPDFDALNGRGTKAERRGDAAAADKLFRQLSETLESVEANVR